jgi:hypothetical protein
MHVPIEPDRSPLAAKRAAAWQDLRKLCRDKKLHIYLYCENPPLTHICILTNNGGISWPQVYDVARKQLIEVPLPHAIAIGSNQVTVEVVNGKSVFVLWYYGQREGKFDPTKLDPDSVRALNAGK